jgi:putative addiction module component (TIGR02574 family)
MGHLPQSLEHLSAAEKFELLDALWESLESDPSAITAEQRAEVRRRVERYREDPSRVRPWEQVEADLLKNR